MSGLSGHVEFIASSPCDGELERLLVSPEELDPAFSRAACPLPSCSATMIRVFPYAGTQFMIFDSLKRWALLRKTRRDPHAPQRLSNIESLMSG